MNHSELQQYETTSQLEHLTNVVMKRVTLKRLAREKRVAKLSPEKIEEYKAKERRNVAVRDYSLIYEAIDVMLRSVHADRDAFYSSSRDGRIVDIRHCAMFITYYYVPMELKEMAGFFERDHATILHAVKKVTALKSGKTMDSRITTMLKTMLNAMRIKNLIVSPEYYLAKEYVPNHYKPKKPR